MTTSVTTDLEYAEHAVLGTVLMTPASVRAVLPLVSPEDFNDSRLGALYALVVGMVGAYGATGVNPASVSAEAARRRAEVTAAGDKPTARLPDIGEILTLITFGAPGAVEPYAKLVRESAILRELAIHGSRVMTSAHAGMDAAVLAAMAVDEAKKIRDGYRTSGLGVRLLADVLADGDLDEYDWVIPDLLERGDRLIITGGEGLGKSTYLRQVALCAAAGVQPFTGGKYPRRTVLVIDSENSERQWHRKTRSIALAVEMKTGIDPARHVHLACVGRKDMTSPKDLGDIHAAIDEYAPDLMVIGPLYKMVPTAINNDTEAAPLINALDSIRERGVTLIMEAHAGKALGQGGERNYAPRGSAALLGWPEFGFGLAPDPEDPSVVHVVRWRGDRDERKWPSRLKRGGTLPWTDNSPATWQAQPGQEGPDDRYR